MARRHYKHPWRKLLNYHIDNFMAKGGFSTFLALVIFFIFSYVVMLITYSLFLVIFPKEDLGAFNDRMYYIFNFLINSTDFLNKEEQSPWYYKLLGFTTSFMGIIFFSSLIAWITNEFNVRIQELRKGKSAVLESGHMVILGFNTRILDIVQELILAHEVDSGVIVILAEKDKQEMDDFFLENISDLKTTRLVTRSGATTSVVSLRRIQIEKARAVIILSPSHNADIPEKKQLADFKILKTALAVLAVTGEKNAPAIVAEIYELHHQNLLEKMCPGKIVGVKSDQILAKLLAQTSKNPGLIFVYMDLAGFAGSEIYLIPIDKSVVNLNFNKLQWHMESCVVLGFLKSSGRIYLNPPKEYQPNANDIVIVLAQDYKALKFNAKMAIQFKKRNYPKIELQEMVEASLIVGWSSKVPLLVEEYGAYQMAGAKVNILVPKLTEQIKYQIDTAAQRYSLVRIRVFEGKVDDPTALSKFALETYDNIIVISEDIHNNPEDTDSTTISRLCNIRNYLDNITLPSGKKPNTHLITEIMDSRNADLVFKIGVRDILIPDKFISKIMTQIAEDVRINNVYNELFSTSGCNIYVKPIWLYFEQFPLKLVFEECIAAAQHRQEVCIGVRISSEKFSQEKHFGIQLMPHGEQEFYFLRDDFLIILSFMPT